MMAVFPKPCHREARVCCEPEDLCNSREAMRLQRNCIGPSGRKKRVPQDDKTLGSKFEGLAA